MQKQVLLVLAALSITVNLNAQVDIIMEGEPGTLYNGDTVYVYGTESVFYPHMQVVNTTGATLNLKWKRLILSTSQPGFSDQLCDNVLCFDATGNPWLRPTTIAIPAGGNSIFQPKLNTNGASGGAHFRYYITDASNVYLDSVDIVFETTVGLEDAKQTVSYQSFPNPASNEFNIKLNATPESVYQVHIYNIMGELVSSNGLVPGLNVISVETLTNGIYFYSIIKNSEIVETKKLIVRH